MYHCEGLDVSDVVNKTDCHNKGPGYYWVNQKYNFDNLGQAKIALLFSVLTHSKTQFSISLLGSVSKRNLVDEMIAKKKLGKCFTGNIYDSIY